ncbi:MAG: hypothetical protein OIN87_05350 [Candidatus Methanoperedens sp.]|nr:hypothetical protein [Candidatus Methanoperedens sp.]
MIIIDKIEKILPQKSNRMTESWGQGVSASALDFARVKQLWQGMESILSEAISRASETAIGKVCPASFGFTGIQSQSGSLVNPVRIISEAMDAVILPDESHRELI